MKRNTRFAGCLVMMAMLATTGAISAQGPGYGQGPGYSQGPGGWEAPPQEFAEAQQRGFRDGIQGAKKDFENHRAPNVNNRDEYRHPGFIPRPDRRSYRIGFERGYQVAVQHMYGHDGRDWHDGRDGHDGRP